MVFLMLPGDAIRTKEVLEKSGVLKSKCDDAIFYWLSNGKLEGYYPVMLMILSGEALSTL